MVSRGLYHKYRRLVERLGLRQVDVYRQVRDGKTTDVVRIMDPSTSKVFLVDLNAPREALTFTEFLDRVLEGARSAQVPLPDRLVAEVKRCAAELDKAQSAEVEQPQRA